MKELITINLGGCGCSVGERFLKLMNKEHGMDALGNLIVSGNEEKTIIRAENQERLMCMYEESIKEEGKYFARTIFVDTDQSEINKLKKDKEIASLLREEDLVSSKEGSTGLVSCVRELVGNGQKLYVKERVRKMLENCDCAEGLIFNYGIGGGSGSCFSALLSEVLKDQFQLPMTSFCVFPSEFLKTDVVEPYNSVWSLGQSIQHFSNMFCLENKSIYNVLQSCGVGDLNHQHVNDLISQMISTYTCPVRFHDGNLKDQIDHLVPKPSLNLISNSMLINVNTAAEDFNLDSITAQQNSMNSIGDQLKGKSVSMMLSSRGKFSNETILEQSFSNSEFCERLKYYNSNSPIETLQSSSINFENYAILSNNSSLINNILESMNERFLKLYTSRAFMYLYEYQNLHWEELENAHYKVKEYGNFEE